LIAGKFNDLVADDTIIIFNKRLCVKDFVLKSEVLPIFRTTFGHFLIEFLS